MRFFKFIRMSTHNFVIHSLKIDLTKTFREKASFEVFEPKVVQNGPKMYFRYYEKLIHGTFLGFLFVCLFVFA